MNFWKKQNRIEELLEQILANQNTLLQGAKKMAATLADLDAELAKSDTTVASLQADTAQLIAQLQAGSPVDVSAQLTHLQAVNAALSAVLASENAAITPVPPAAAATKA
jgi:predicted  nucleic acid-binding Zn-ribbon protein